MGFLESNDLEGLKGDIYRSFFKGNYSECINLSNKLIHRRDYNDDITYNIYGYIFKGLSNELLENIDDAIESYLEVDKYDLIGDLVLDDLWVYFFLGLAKSKLGYFQKKNYSFEEIYNTTKQGFEMFPENEMDFKHDLENNLRMGIVKKYLLIIEDIFNPFRLKFTLVSNKEGVTNNTGLVNEDNQLVAMFGYKRTNFYGEEYKDKAYRNMIDDARDRMQK